MVLMILGYWMAFASVGAFAAFGWDKTAAKLRRDRVPESVLLTMCGVGGWPGGVLAMSLFRHKTKKQPFNLIVKVIVFGWLALGAAAFLLAEG